MEETSPRVQPSAPSEASLSLILPMAAALALLVAGIWIHLDSWESSFLAPQDVPIELFLRQDLVALGYIIVTLLVCGLVVRFTRWRVPDFRVRPGWGAVIVVAYLATAIPAVTVVYERFALCLDEFMARFQARAIAGGAVLPPVSSEWMPLTPRLQPLFMVYDPHRLFWVPTYRPGNGAWLALFEVAGLLPWAHVVTGAGALFAVSSLAKKIYPARPWAGPLASLLLASSSQFWITSLTSYAMTPHLLVAAVWLLLFLRGDGLGLIGSAVVGALGVGLHAVHVQPLVYAPFLFWLVRDGRWSTAFGMVVWYGAVVVAWMGWVDIAATSLPVGLDQQAAIVPAPAGFLDTVMKVLGRHTWHDATLWLANLSKLMSWQSVALWPLAVTGVLHIGSAPRAVKAGGASIGLTLVLHALVQPGQGHGWGYRYLHPQLIFFCLFAVHGASCIADTATPERRRAATTAICGLVLASAPLLALRALQVHDFIQPWVRAVTAMREEAADIVLVDQQGAWFAVDTIRNDPFLVARPKVLSATRLGEAALVELCARGSVAVFDHARLGDFGMHRGIYHRDRDLAERAWRAGCRPRATARSFDGRPPDGP